MEEPAAPAKECCKTCGRGQHPLVLQGILNPLYQDVLSEPAESVLKNKITKRIFGGRLMTGWFLHCFTLDCVTLFYKHKKFKLTS